MSNNHNKNNQKTKLDPRTMDVETNFHPLEIIPFFKQWPSSFVRNFIYTLILNTLFAIGLVALSAMIDANAQFDRVLSMFGNTLLISNACGFLFWGSFVLLDPLMRYMQRKSFFYMFLFYTCMSISILVLIFLTLSLFQNYSNIRQWFFAAAFWKNSIFTALVIGIVLASITQKRKNELIVSAKIAAEKERADAAKLLATQANLRALQAQIEPHFLFNTLANVSSLIDTKPELAKQMLEKFIFYLRATLQATRIENTTFADEFLLMEQFLSILKIRMGTRLQVDIQLDDALKNHAIAPMLLQPIIENAIKHGIDPKIEGGTISLIAYQQNQHIHIDIKDDGVGFQNAKSNGIGLKNVRERLTSLYSGQASLSIQEQPQGGTCITIILPL